MKREGRRRKEKRKRNIYLENNQETLNKKTIKGHIFQ